MVLTIQKNAEPIPGYRLVEPLGRGGFGEVWKVEAPGGLLKAIKFVFGNLEDSGDSRRADQELRSLSRVRSLRHPFLLSLERYDIIDGQLVIVMELADRDLMDRFRECRQGGLPGIPAAELLRYLDETAEVLDLMNLTYDLQHLDVKPQNLCLLHNHVKVADFGLVKDLTGLVGSVTGGLTPKYAPPETFAGTVSRSSDQYSLALVYQELLTGSSAFSGASLQEIMQQHTSGKPDLTNLPEGERAAVARALAKEPSQRFPSCRAFVEALRGQDDTTRTVAPPSRRPAALLEPAVLENAPPALSERHRTTRARPGDLALPSHRQADAALLERTEEVGDGVLTPALVLGVGGFGLEALRQFRRTLRAHLGDPQQLPHLRLLGIDTDSNALELAQQGSAAVALEREEILIARLARAAHYQRPRDPLPPVKDWLPQKMLHRISRSQGTSGFRALGRLAFVDNYASIVSALRRRLEQITAPDALPTAARRSGLPLRSNRPRVYLLASLAGGTGSGMMVDLAYVLRALLHEFGHGRAELVGLFLLPPGGQNPELTLARANGYAALAEVSHFADPATTFAARYDSRAPTLGDEGAPFTRCLLLQNRGQGPGVRGQGEESGGSSSLTPDPWPLTPALAADHLYLDLFTPLGREADSSRKQAQAQLTGNLPAPFQTFGLNLLRSPSRPLLREASRCLAQTIVAQWTQGGSPQAVAQVRQEIVAQLHDQNLDPANLLELMQKSCSQTLGARPEQILGRWLDPVAGQAGRFDPRHIARILRQADEFFGHPEGEDGLQQPPATAAIRHAANEVGEHARQALSQLAAGYLQRPGPRLGLTVEALKQAGAQVDRWLQLQDEVLAEGQARVKRLREQLEAGADAAERLGQAAGSTPEARRLREELLQQLSAYPKARYQLLLGTGVRGVYLALRGYLSDQVRELAFYRHPLEALHRALAEEAREMAGLEEQTTPPLLPANCATLEEAAAQVLRGLPVAFLLALDEAVQAAVQEYSDGQAAVWTVAGSDRGVKVLGDILVQQAEKFLRERLPAHDVAELFLGQAADEAALAERLRGGFDAAAPVPAGMSAEAPLEISAMLAPDSVVGTRLLRAARDTLPGTSALAADRYEEIVFYREALGLKLWDLERLGLLDREAYRRVCGRENHAAHTRTDILRWGESLTTQ